MLPAMPPPGPANIVSRVAMAAITSHEFAGHPEVLAPLAARHPEHRHRGESVKNVDDGLSCPGRDAPAVTTSTNRSAASGLETAGEVLPGARSGTEAQRLLPASPGCTPLCTRRPAADWRRRPPHGRNTGGQLAPSGIADRAPLQPASPGPQGGSGKTSFTRDADARRPDRHRTRQALGCARAPRARGFGGADRNGKRWREAGN